MFSRNVFIGPHVSHFNEKLRPSFRLHVLKRLKCYCYLLLIRGDDLWLGTEKNRLLPCIEEPHLHLARDGIFNKHPFAFDFQYDLWAQTEYLLDRLNPDVDRAGLLRPLNFDTRDDPLLQRRSSVKVAQSSIGAETGCSTGNGNTPFSTRSKPLRSAQFDLLWIG